MYLLQAQPSGGIGITPIFMGLMLLVFLAVLYSSASQKAKQQKTFIDNLQRGDKVVTIAGIHGTINKVNDDGTISLEINPGSYLKIEKSAISLEWTTGLNKPAVATTDAK